MNKLTAVLEDLEAESLALDTVVASLDEEGWRTATPAERWDIATQIAHLAWTDGATVAAAAQGASWAQLSREAEQDITGLVDREALQGAGVAPAELLSRWRRSRATLVETLRAVPEGSKLPWFGPPMSATSMATARLMETWAHSVDVHDALGLEPTRTDRVRHVALLGALTRGFAFRAHGQPDPDEVFVSLTLPSGAQWQHGDPGAADVVRGSAYDFALRVTQRRHRDDLDLVAEGPGADQWLDLAQAFAGPPGPGRAPAAPVG
ncbi:TIGR03084 family metal-binding protein [Ornithinimicrobium cryptoxanthini]|uniref:TIGR03084 family metal-binding protein n=1 Tax=Ornithinimicrobium cryptoxanthini TaxID=2934161 RepID=A0ABY4YH98_9MICO|nr:TIGR03084 family metal-binding protein [Ornithinimicrobium cryptoxanthini]USQ75900.1 TIGR03084 family metal-binding protein [Ornithinimicrobium cryptoxanthini]